MSNSRKRLTDLPTRKPRTRKEMIAFLTDHFRYDTMNGWNRATSYAVKIKATHLDLTDEETSRVFEVLEAKDCRDASGFTDILRQFDEDHDHYWKIGTNGRNGGYAVLYQCEKRDSGYKSRCTNCGQLNYKTIEPGDNRCGRCNQDTRINLTSPRIEVISYPGKGLDMEKDYKEWETDALRSRVKLVWEFDLAVEDACREFLEWAMAHKVEEQTIMVPKTIKIAVPD